MCCCECFEWVACLVTSLAVMIEVKFAVVRPVLCVRVSDCLLMRLEYFVG